MRLSHYYALAVLATCLACSSRLSASDDDGLFGPSVKQAPVKVYTSKQPDLLPPEQPAAFDLFGSTPSPTVESLKAHAEKRLLPEADKPVVVGMCAEGVIASYDEAYRLSLKTGKPLRVLVGQPVEHVMRQGKTEDGFLKCRIDDGMDHRFTARGVYEFEPVNGQLYVRGQAPRQVSRGPSNRANGSGDWVTSVSRPACSSCGDPDCKCGCRYGGTCRCGENAGRPQSNEPLPEVVCDAQGCRIEYRGQQTWIEQVPANEGVGVRVINPPPQQRPAAQFAQPMMFQNLPTQGAFFSPFSMPMGGCVGGQCFGGSCRSCGS
jgi:hypothetical protein